MKITSNEILWDLEEEKLCMTTMECARLLSEQEHKPITIKNVNHETWQLIWGALDMYHSIGNRLDNIEKVINFNYAKEKTNE